MKNAASTEKLSRSALLGSQLLYEAMKALKEAKDKGDEGLNLKKIYSIIEEKVSLNEWAKERLPKSGHVRWPFIMHLYSINFTKAGFLIKEKGNWHITPEGENAFRKGATYIFSEAIKKYKEWKRSKKNPHHDDDEQLDPEKEAVVEEIETLSQQLEEAEADSRELFKNHIKKLNAYDFQDLCAALLRGMGYFTPHTSSKGKDGGIDIIAYQDPIGASSTKIIVQVKHYIGSGQAVGSDEIDKLAGNIRRSVGNVGLFITSSNFTDSAKNKYRIPDPHIELINLDKFINLWCQFYSKMTDEDKALMPIKSVYFLVVPKE
jgi:restriction system protein